MRLAEYSKPIRICLGLHEALRKLGFPSSSIFFAPHDDRIVLVVIHDEKECAFLCGDSYKDCFRDWQDAGTQWNTAEDDERREIYREWLGLGMSIPLLNILIRQGMYPVELEN